MWARLARLSAGMMSHFKVDIYTFNHAPRPHFPRFFKKKIIKVSNFYEKP